MPYSLRYFEVSTSGNTSILRDIIQRADPTVLRHLATG